jgi:Transglutaminase-like superfamily
LKLPFTRWFLLPAQERRRTIEAAATLLQVRLSFGLLPFARALRLLRVEQRQVGVGPAATDEAAEVTQAISRAARHVPFRALCLEEAFAALLMLRRRGCTATVHIGAKRGSDGNALTAHAWCCSGAVPVTGFPTAQQFVAVANFSA